MKKIACNWCQLLLLYGNQNVWLKLMPTPAITSDMHVILSRRWIETDCNCCYFRPWNCIKIVWNWCQLLVLFIHDILSTRGLTCIWTLSIKIGQSQNKEITETEVLSWQLLYHQWRLKLTNIMASRVFVKIGSGNGLMPNGTKPLPEPMLTYHQYDHVAFTWGQFHWKCSKYQSLNCIWKLNI